MLTERLVHSTVCKLNIRQCNIPNCLIAVFLFKTSQRKQTHYGSLEDPTTISSLGMPGSTAHMEACDKRVQ
jgi:hypothetical protein